MTGHLCGILASLMMRTVSRGVVSSGAALKSTSFASSILLNVKVHNGIPPRSFRSGPQIRFTEKLLQPSSRQFASSLLNVGIQNGSPRSISGSPRICSPGPIPSNPPSESQRTQKTQRRGLNGQRLWIEIGGKTIRSNDER